MEQQQEPKKEKIITIVIKGIKNAVSFCRANSDLKPKMRTVTGTDDFYISYLLNQKTTDD